MINTSLHDVTYERHAKHTASHITHSHFIKSLQIYFHINVIQQPVGSEFYPYLCQLLFLTLYKHNKLSRLPSGGY